MLSFSFEYNCFWGWGSKLLLIIALKLYKTTPQGALPYPSSRWSNLMVCIHRLMGMISSHKMHMTKSSACFTNALQLLYPVNLNTAKTWHTIEALLGMTVGFSRFSTDTFKVACTKSSPEISILGKISILDFPKILLHCLL